MSCESKKDKPEEIILVTSEGSSTLFPEPKVDIKTVGILLYDGFANLDAVGPYAVFTSLVETDVFFVGLNDCLIEDVRDMKVQVDTTINEVNQLDILFISVGFKERLELTKDGDPIQLD